MSLHGGASTKTIYAQLKVMSDTLRASGEFTLRQIGFVIKLVNFAGDAWNVKDEVKLTFDLICRKQEG